ncbi:epoxyqueuosine reductase [Sporomusa termitida]|uniref:Epoxyqueuosine reductase n=1 Tax=Sporomusa termitida TaxID=2377 RepID=A0A517DQD7_9FIRM|nr:epoxyqueuosine reductase [Sporomusa termitida]QDR79537.1 Epoxyqueuosine reductase [Sporomusa termitida]
MSTINYINLTSTILKKAKEFGATLAGIANIDDLRQAPSFTVAPKMPEYNGVGAREEKLHTKSLGEVDWPKGAQSVIVIAYAHPQSQPELDYWYGRSNPIGNKRLIRIVNDLKDWLQDNYKIESVALPYHIEKGGIYLKDAAVLAGMGCVGKNNLLITPEYGSHIRLRALAINQELSSSGPIPFYPCVQCEEYCRKGCPQQAFSQKIYTFEEFGEENLPGRTGHYNRLVCNIQMKLDEERAETQITEECKQLVKVVKYCRNCEYACPIGMSCAN